MEPTIDYSGYVGKPSDDKFARLHEIVKQQLSAEDAVAEAEKVLALAQQNLKLLKETTLPDYMKNDLGLDEITLNDGTVVEVKEQISAGISKERNAAAMAWLRDPKKGNAAQLIKNIVAVAFAKGEDKDAEALVKQLEKQKLQVDNVQTVHAQTLGAWVREKLKSGSLPDEAMTLLGVHRQNFAKLSRKE